MKYDVIVIGAGPAGNIAALRLARSGRAVAVVDMRERLGDKLCTGIIGRECFERYGPEPSVVFHAASSAVFHGPSGRGYRVTHPQVQAYVIDRVAFVDSLARRAQEAGAHFHLGARVTGLELAEEGATVWVDRDGRGRILRGRALVLAAGFGSPLLRMAGLGCPRRGQYMVGCQAEVEADGVGETQVYLGHEVAPGSFGWLVPLDGSRALAGLVSRQRLNGHMDAFLERLGREGRIRSVIRPPRRWGIPIRPIPRTYGRRFVVVGDSAGLVKPTTGGGIYYALLSGELAADVLDQGLEEGDLSEDRLRGYERAWKELFGRELTVGYYARLLYEALGDRQIEALLSGVLDSPLQERLMRSREFSFDWHSGLIVKALLHQDLRRLFLSFGPAVRSVVSRVSALMPFHGYSRVKGPPVGGPTGPSEG